LEAWEKVYVGYEFVADVHNTQNCIGCHGGIAETDDMDAAHAGVVRDPLEESDRACSVCHTESSRLAATSLHQNLTGYHTALEARGADMSDPAMQEAFENHCDDCHTTCGQCHISRPTALGGGLLREHEVRATASMKDTCLACHGARVGNEYQGKNEGVEGSVHWLKGGMTCYECHDITHYHGDGTEYTHRYDGPPGVDCLECHLEATPEETDILEHKLHDGKVACEVCHVSGPYKSCYNCHVGLDDEGLPYRRTDESQLTLKIGRNPLKSEDRPWDYVLLRHAPAVPDTFAFYDDDLLPDFDNVPTWKYATPHNIQRDTAQNQSCDSCHANEDLFLTAYDVAPQEMEANAQVIVERVPPIQPHPGLENYNIPEACVGCHPKATEENWELISENIHSLNWVVEPTGDVILCEDCHGPDNSFDWASAGYGPEEASQFIWTDYPPTTTASHSAEPSWFGVLALGFAIAVVLNVVGIIVLTTLRSKPDQVQDAGRSE
jgi:thiosulfate/3-mercaptopyruvate sulfurtransferase